MESCNEVLTFGYVDEILWCENKTSLAELESHTVEPLSF